jgi:cysteine desulfurase/selenocysteine lyase
MPSTVSRAPLDVEALRASEFPFARETCYLNTASVGPIPERTRRAVAAFNDRRARIHEMDDAELGAILERSREVAARMIGASADEIALGWNTSFGINLAALSLPVESGSCVVVSEREFPANVYPWMGHDKVRLELVPTDAVGRPDEDRLLERLDRGDVSVFALSAVQFASGYRADLAKFGRFCRERGIFFVVDGIQALGQVPIDVREMEIDVLATGGHKWLCAPFGTGFAYVRPELLSKLEPRVIGWSSMQACEDYGSLLDYRWGFQPDARKFEVATPAFQDFAGFAASLELLLEVGVEAIETHLREVLSPLVDWLRDHPEVEVISDLNPAHRSGILCFRPPAAEAVFEALQADGIACVLREGAIRISPHLYSTQGEIERVVQVFGRSGAR